MSWSSVQDDWSGFMAIVRQMLPSADFGPPPPPAPDLSAFCAALSRAAEVTRAEAEELVLLILLPAWASRRPARAAA